MVNEPHLSDDEPHPVSRSTLTTTKNVILITLLASIAGLVSVLLGQDANFDLQNYHIYTAFALLDHRHQLDPGTTLGWYLNPVLDVPYYLLSRSLNDYPRAVAFIQGLYAGVLWFILWHLISLIQRTYKLDKWLTIVAWLVACTGTMVVSEIGTTFNDIQEAILVAYGVLLIAKYLVCRTNQAALFFGFLLIGAAVGLKMTSGIYIVAAAIALLAATRSYKPMGIAIVAGTTGVLITGGWWLVYLDAHYGSPLFPLFNSIFHSPWWPETTIVDRRFFPRNILQWLFYPAYWVTSNKGLVTEVSFADSRMLIGLISTVATLAIGATYLVRSTEKKANATRCADEIAIFFVTFYLCAYTIWLCAFSIYRYAVLLECLSALLVLILISVLCKFTHFYKIKLICSITACIIFVAAVAATKYPNWMRASYSSQVFDIHVPFNMGGATVLADDASPPLSYLFPSLHGASHFITVGGNDFVGTKMYLKESHLIDHSNKLVVITNQDTPLEFSKRLAQYWNIVPSHTACGTIRSNINGSYKACRFRHRSPGPRALAPTTIAPGRHYQARITLVGQPEVTADGKNILVTINVTNIGAGVFGSDTKPHPVNLGAHSISASGRVIDNDLSRGYLPQLPPGASATTSIQMPVTQLVGKRAEIAPVQEGVNWFNLWSTDPTTPVIVGPFEPCGHSARGAVCNVLGKPLPVVHPLDSKVR